MKLKIPWNRLPGSPWLYGAAGGLVLFVGGGILATHYFPQVKWIAAPAQGFSKPEPATAEPTKLADKMPTEIHECRPTVVYKPSPKQEAKLEEKFHVELSAPSSPAVLANVEIPKAPQGGEVLVTSTPEGQTVVAFAPDRPSFFELGGPFEVGGGVLWDSRDGQGVRLHAGKDLARIWKINVKATADLDLIGGRTETRAALLGVVRF